MSSSNSAHDQAVGPEEPFDINVDDETFNKLIAWHSRYGDLVSINPLQRKSPAFVLNHPDLVHHVLIANHKNYAKGVGFERVKMLLGNGIIVSDGDFWRSQRRMIQPAFHRKIIASQSAQMVRCNEQKLAQWREKAKTQTVINLTEEMSELALEVVLRALFSDDLDDLIEEQAGNPFSLLVDDVTRDLKLAMRFRALTKHVTGIMEKRRRESRIEHDFLSLLMETRDKDTGEPMSDKALVDEVMTIIVAGHETTAGTLNWAWYSLSQHRDIEKTLHEEVDRLLQAPGFDHLAELSFTRQVIEETLRLYPPVWLFSRKAINEDRFLLKDKAYQVPAGSDIFLCPYTLHRDARFWSQPQQFNPSRFAPEASKDRNKNVFYPFSLGSRRCIGEFFSLVDMQLHLGLLAKHIRLEHVTDRPVAIEPHINLRSRDSIMMLPVLRKSVKAL